jgi:hypothetical protein
VRVLRSYVTVTTALPSEPSAGHRVIVISLSSTAGETPGEASRTVCLASAFDPPSASSLAASRTLPVSWAFTL